MDSRVYSEIRRMLAPLERRLMLVASRAVLTLVKEGEGLQGVQAKVLDEEVFDEDTEHMQPGGLTHKPLTGAEGIFLSIGGVRDDGVIICISDRRHRPKDLEDGETCLYNEGDNQARVWCKKDGSIALLAGAGDGAITLTKDKKIEITGDLLVSGEITAMAATPATAVKVSTHLHPHPMGPTSAPTPGT